MDVVNALMAESYYFQYTQVNLSTFCEKLIYLIEVKLFSVGTLIFFKKNPYLSNKCFDKTIMKKLMYYFRTLQNLKKDIRRKTEENFCYLKFEDFIKVVDKTLAK